MVAQTVQWNINARDVPAGWAGNQKLMWPKPFAATPIVFVTSWHTRLLATLDAVSDTSVTVAIRNVSDTTLAQSTKVVAVGIGTV